MWGGFEDIDPEFAIQKICNSHDVSLELLLQFPVMSSVDGGLDPSRLP